MLMPVITSVATDVARTGLATVNTLRVAVILTVCLLLKSKESQQVMEQT